MLSFPSRNQTLTIAVEKHAKLDITFLKSWPILLFLFCPELRMGFNICFSWLNVFQSLL